MRPGENMLHLSAHMPNWTLRRPHTETGIKRAEGALSTVRYQDMTAIMTLQNHQPVNCPLRQSGRAIPLVG